MKSSRIWIPLSLAIAVGGVACSAGSGSNDPAGSSASSDDKSGHVKVDAGQKPPKTVPVVQSLVETPIVTNQTDPKLINAWGLSFNPVGAAWVNENGLGQSSVFGPTSAPSRLMVTIPAPPGATGPSAPTGIEFNEDDADFMGDSFVFVTEDGTIAGWQSGTQAVLRVDNSGSGAVYKGMALVNTTALNQGRLFAANFNSGKVDVFDTSYRPVRTQGGFVDRNLPGGFAPFNIMSSERGAFIFVSYALQDAMKHDDVAGLGNGFVDVFDIDGNLLTRLISQGVLNSPWGMAIAPHEFGDVADTLLVGNFGDGFIHAFTLSGCDKSKKKDMTVQLLGVIGDSKGQPLAIDGLWSLVFGVDAGGFSSNTLYFTAGPAMETQGIFGMLALP